MGIFAPPFQPIDWRKPHLRIGYLIEGEYATEKGHTRRVRWCGPRERTGSGLAAMSSATGLVAPGVTGLQTPLVAWEPRLSGCVYDQTVGTLKQTIQAISDVTVGVALEDADINPSREIDAATYLGDAAMYGRWKGHDAVLWLVDLDDVAHGEAVGEGTWDRDPTNLTPRGFRMTISIGEVIPPNMEWPMAQIPQTTDYWETFSYNTSAVAAGPFSPTGGASPDFGINDDHKGRWFGQIFGGDALYFQSTDPYESPGRLWKELVTYGATTTHHFALVSPRYDQFCYDVAYENTSGEVIYVSGVGGSTITVFNNNDPLRGPTGTIVKFSTSSFSPWSRKNRVWGKVAGGPLGHFNRPAGYTDIGYEGDPAIGSALYAANDQAEPEAALGPAFTVAATFWTVFEDIIVNFLGGELHPDAMQILIDYYTLTVSPTSGQAFLGACVPLRLVERPPSMRAVLADLMLTIPGDLILRIDEATSAKQRKWVALPRPRGGEPSTRTFFVGDLYNSDPERNVSQMSDPDGNYSNETTVGTAEYWAAPDATEDKIDNQLTDEFQMIDLVEQSSAGVNQVITDDARLAYWKFQKPGAVEFWGPDIEAAKSRPQVVLEALHGLPSLTVQVGDLVDYDIRGVYAGVGQVRGLLLDLDAQTLKVTTFHEPPDAERIHEGSGTEKSKERLEANRDIPEKAGKGSRRGQD